MYIRNADTKAGNSQKCDATVTVQKTVALVLTLAKLHNYCIDADGNSDLTYTASDEWQTEVNGTVPLIAAQDSQSTRDVVLEQLLDGGHHFDDIGGVNGRYKVPVQ